MRVQGNDKFDEVYRHIAEVMILADALWVLAHSLGGSRDETVKNELLDAYVYGGTVVNKHIAQRSPEEAVHAGNCLGLNQTSHRFATMPRDYIFATMPSFP